MRVLLRSTDSRNYIQDGDKWTADPGSARDFGTSGRAVLFAMENHLTGLEVVLAFENSQYDLAIPLQNTLSHASREKRKR